jgi:hypothetical protein
MSKEWEEKVEQLNKLHTELQQKPKSEKKGYSLHPGGVLNAYREGDLSLDEAILKLGGLPMFLSSDQFFALKGLIKAAEVAEQEPVTSMDINIKPYGTIRWIQGGKVNIELGVGK